MPFSRPSTPTLPMALATAVATLLATAAAVMPAHAEQTPAEPAQEQTQAEQTPTALAVTTTADAGAFCPRPTGRWWEDVTARGCVELLAGRDHTTPLTTTELTWLDLGGLPAYGTVDIDALDTTLTAHRQQLADEAAAAAAAAEQAAREAAEREAARRAARTRSAAMRRVFSPGELDAIAARCGFTPGTAPTPAQDACLAEAMAAPAETGPSAPAAFDGYDSDQTPESAAHAECLEVVGGDPDLIDRDATYAYFDAVARCVDARIPGYHARWVVEEAQRQAQYEEGMRRSADAWAAFQARVEAAREEAAATCPDGWLVSYFAWMVKSYDDVEITITCS